MILGLGNVITIDAGIIPANENGNLRQRILNDLDKYQ